MSVLRQDVSTQEWVVIATERAKRPHDFARPKPDGRPEADASSCPFCPGHERFTPPETLAFRKGGEPNGAGWWVRVMPNKFAALSPSGPPVRARGDGFFPSMDGVGVHEVIVETPSHVQSLALLDSRHVAEVLFAYRLRFCELRKDSRWKAIILFKNHGERAGTSLTHPHSQLVATPVVPHDIRARHAMAQQHYDNTGMCIYCEMLRHELIAKKRVVDQSPHFVAIHPFASRSPFETWILPRTHRPSFGNIEDREIKDLANILRGQLRKLHFALGDPDYNLIVHTAPLEDEDKDYYLWHLQVLPRLTTIAGFELGSGMFINTALPEETAEFIRNAATV